MCLLSPNLLLNGGTALANWVFRACMFTAIALNHNLNHNILPARTETVINDNYSSKINHQVKFLASTIKKSLATVAPVTETEELIPKDNPSKNNSDADDPAIYIHPQDPSQSLIIATFKDGGLGVYNLTGKKIQNISPPNIRYNNVDIAYGVEYQSQIVGQTATVDLAIASDRANDTLAIFAINTDGRDLAANDILPLQEVTSLSIFDSIFGVDDGEATAYGLTTYTSVDDGTTYAFVSQSDGNKIAQLEIQPELGAADELTVNAQVVATFELPIPKGLVAEDALVEGMVVDKETGMLYLAQENFGIWKINADPTEKFNERSPVLIDSVKSIKPDSPLSADIEGLTIYYGDNGTKYLIASSQGDSTFAIYDLAQDNSYLGSFAVEGVGKTDGLDITNIFLGEQYPAGLLVVQDGVNKVSKNSLNTQNNGIGDLNPNFKFVSAKDIFDNY